MSLLDIGLQGLALERDHVGESEKVIKFCSSLKSIRNKAKQQAPIHTLECTFSELELKGKPIKIFKPQRDQRNWYKLFIR